MSANFTPEMDDYKEIKKGPIFIRFVLENFPLLTDDFDAMTYYGALCKIVDYMKKLIDNETSLENNMTALYDAYNQLQDYVNHYFDNLDIQEEINNKLDEMAEQGVLADIIAQYIQLQGILAYNSVADMKVATNLVDGSFAETYGYYSYGDGGSAKYKIRQVTNQDVEDDAFIIALNDTNLVAELIVDNNTIDVKTMGAKGDGETDDSIAIQKAFDYFDVSTPSFENDMKGKVVFSTGNYVISQTIKIPYTVSVDFCKSTITADDNGIFTSDFMFFINTTDGIDWIQAYPPYKQEIQNAYIIGNSNGINAFLTLACTNFKNILFQGFKCGIRYGEKYLDEIEVSHCNFWEQQGTNEFYIEKLGEGEGCVFKNLSFSTNKNSESTNLPMKSIYITTSFGSIIRDCVNGVYKLENNEKITLNNIHIEKGYIEAIKTSVSVENCNIYHRWQTVGTAPIILNNSEANITNTDILIRRRLFGEHTSDVTSFDIDTQGTTKNIIINNSYRKYDGDYAKPNFESTYGLTVKINNSKSIKCLYEITEIKNGNLVNQEKYLNNWMASNNATISDLVDQGSNIVWDKSAGTYYYRFALYLDLPRKLGRISKEFTYTNTTNNKGCRIEFPQSTKGCIWRIYRGTSSNSYNEYVEIPNSLDGIFYDNGTLINGIKWQTREASNYENYIIGREIKYINHANNENNIECIGDNISPSATNFVDGDVMINNSNFTQRNCLVGGTWISM